MATNVNNAGLYKEVFGSDSLKGPVTISEDDTGAFLAFTADFRFRTILLTVGDAEGISYKYSVPLSWLNSHGIFMPNIRDLEAGEWTYSYFPLDKPEAKCYGLVTFHKLGMILTSFYSNNGKMIGDPVVCPIATDLPSEKALSESRKAHMPKQEDAYENYKMKLEGKHKSQLQRNTSRQHTSQHVLVVPSPQAVPSSQQVAAYQVPVPYYVPVGQAGYYQSYPDPRGAIAPVKPPSPPVPHGMIRVEFEGRFCNFQNLETLRDWVQTQIAQRSQASITF